MRSPLRFRGRSSILPQLALLVGSLLLAAALGEGLLRVASPFEEQRLWYMKGRNVFQYDPAHVRYDPELGFFHRPQLDVQFRNREFDTRVVTNSFGLRDDEASLHDSKILLLGDSFAFGWGVEKAESLEGELEKLLRVPVLNLAVAGFATSQELLLLERFATEQPLRGRIALFQFYGNDLMGIEKDPGGVFPALLEDSTGLQFSHPPPESFEEMLRGAREEMAHGLTRHSMLADLASRFFLRLRGKLDRMRGASPKRPSGIDTEEPTDGRSPDDAAEVAAAPEGVAPLAVSRRLRLLLGEIRTFAQRESVQVAFIYVPSVRYYEGRLDYDHRAFWTLSPALAAEQIPLVDLREILTRDDYYHFDDHWRPSGHAKAARTIAEFLVEHRFLP